MTTKEMILAELKELLQEVRECIVEAIEIRKEIEGC